MKALAPLFLALVAAVAPAAAQQAAPLRIGVSGDYPPFSFAPGEDPMVLQGFDLAVGRAYATDRQRELEIVRFRWPELLADLAAERFDVAMSGITIRPERSVAGVSASPSWPAVRWSWSERTPTSPTSPLSTAGPRGSQ